MNNKSRAWGFFFAILAAFLTVFTNSLEAAILPGLAAIHCWLEGVGEHIADELRSSTMKDFGVSRTLISQILSGKIWRHLLAERGNE
jgi:hypothetical protein